METRHDAEVARYRARLTALARERWGEARAAELDASIVDLARALALVAGQSLEPADAMPRLVEAAQAGRAPAGEAGR